MVVEFASVTVPESQCLSFDGQKMFIWLFYQTRIFFKVFQKKSQ